MTTVGATGDRKGASSGDKDQSSNANFGETRRTYFAYDVLFLLLI